MKDLTTIKTHKDLENSMKLDWKYQVSTKQKHGTYPTNTLPSKVYIALYDSMPFSSSRKHLLKELDKIWLDTHGENWQFVFAYKSAKIPIRVENVSGYEDAYKHALSQLVHSGVGITSITLAKHLMNTGELQFDSSKL